MATLETPRLKRTFDYVSQEVYADTPSLVAPLKADYDRMLAQDTSEREMVRGLLTAVLIMLAGGELEDFLFSESGRH